MPVFNNILAGAAGSGGAAAYEIERSLRFNDDDSAYLNRTPSSASNTSTWTFSCWVKRSEIGSIYPALLSAGANSQVTGFFQITVENDEFSVYMRHSSGTNYAYTNAKLRDTSAWYHLVVAMDTTAATEADRLKMYVNGVEQTFRNSSIPAQNTTFLVNGNAVHQIGATKNSAGTTNAFYAGYMADVHLVDGQALDETSFGEFDADTGVWNPIEYTGTYGTNGFYLDFSDNSSAAALGYDAAGSNDWTVNNIKADTPYGVIRGGYAGSTTNAPPPSAAGWPPGLAYTAIDTSVLPSGGFTTGTSNFIPASGISSFYMKMFGSDNPNGPWTHIAHWTQSETIASSNWSNYDYLAFLAYNVSPTPAIGDHVFTVSSSLASGSNVLVQGYDRDADNLLDSPTNYEASSGNNGGNYATWNPLTQKGVVTCSNGNLTADTVTNGNGWVVSSIPVSSGKYYCEISFGDIEASHNTNFKYIGIVPTSSQAAYTNLDIFRANGALSIDSNGTSYIRGTLGTGGGDQNVDYQTNYGFDENDVIGIAIDCDTPQVTFYKNGVSTGTFPHAMQGGKSWVVFMNDWASGYTDIEEYFFNAGQRPFAFAPPTGFKSMCTQNLPDPTIADGSTAFDAKLFTGNGTSQTITGYNFSPDFAWFKSRNGTDWHALVDSVRGKTKVLFSNATTAEETRTEGISSFNSDGFSLGDYAPMNKNNDSLVAWAWDGGDLATVSSLEQSQTWSTAVDTTGSSTINTSSHPISNAFDGVLIGDGLDYAGTVAGDQNTLIFDFGYGFLNGKTVEVYIGSNPTSTHQWGLDGTNWVDHGSTTNDWISLGTGTNTSKVHAICYGNENGAYIAAVRVDGKQLVDPGIIPVGSLNSSIYNSSQTWSTYGTQSGDQYTATAGTYIWADVFDNLSDSPQDVGYCVYGPNQKWTFTNPVSVSSSVALAVWGLGTVTLNAGESNAVTLTSGGQYYNTISTTSLAGATLKNIQLDVGTAVYLFSVHIDGARLVDPNIAPLTPSTASTVRANQTAGFSISTYTGTGSNGSFAHNLNATPELVIVKTRTDGNVNWTVWHEALAASDYLTLNTTNAKGTQGTVWNSTAPTSSVIHVGSDVGTNKSADEYIAYCFASVEGYSAIGSYTGNGSADGPMVTTSFRPAFILTKGIDDAEDWYIRDTARSPFNEVDESLRPNDTGSEYSGRKIDILSNGFKIRDSDSQINENGKSYLYYAVAENPFKTARAR